MTTQTSNSNLRSTAFATKVFATLALMLGITATTAIGANSLKFPEYFNQHPFVFFCILLFEVLLVGAYGFLKEMKLLLLPMLFGYTVLNGITLSVIVNYYSIRVLLEALVASGGLFVVLGAMSAMGVNVFRAEKLLIGSLWTLIITMIVGVYLQSSMFDLAVSGCAVLVFSGFTLLDLNKLELYSVCSHTIFDVLDSALNLYLDFINLFLNLARLLSGNDKD